MTTLANTERCGACLCCEAGTHCARVPILSPKDRADLERLRRLFGEPSGRTIHLKPSAAERARRADPPEPTITVTCSRCGEPWDLLAFVANTLKLRGHAIPPCPYCANAREERADLR